MDNFTLKWAVATSLIHVSYALDFSGETVPWSDTFPSSVIRMESMSYDRTTCITHLNGAWLVNQVWSGWDRKGRTWQNFILIIIKNAFLQSLVFKISYIKMAAYCQAQIGKQEWSCSSITGKVCLCTILYYTKDKANNSTANLDIPNPTYNDTQSLCKIMQWLYSHQHIHKVTRKIPAQIKFTCLDIKTDTAFPFPVSNMRSYVCAVSCYVFSTFVAWL